MRESSVLRLVNAPERTVLGRTGEEGPFYYKKLMPFQFLSGDRMENIALSYSTAGNPKGKKIVILGGISAHRYICSSRNKKGWWSKIVGSGKAIDLNRYFVISMDYIGGAHGSTVARELTRKNGGNPVSISTFDQAHGIKLVMDQLGIHKVDFFIGASYGGMVGLAFAQRFPLRLKSLVCISAPQESVPQAIALRSIQREIVALGKNQKSALSLARKLAMVTYRTPEELNQRFESGNTETDEPLGILGYLESCGRKFSDTFPAESFLVLSESLDTHRVDPSAIRVPTHLIGVDSDLLVPFPQLARLARLIRGPVFLHKLTSLYGHDAFLKDVFTFSKLIKTILEHKK